MFERKSRYRNARLKAGRHKTLFRCRLVAPATVPANKPDPQFLIIRCHHKVSTYFSGHLMHQSTQKQKVRRNSRLRRNAGGSADFSRGRTSVGRGCVYLRQGRSHDEKYDCKDARNKRAGSCKCDDTQFHAFSVLLDSDAFLNIGDSLSLAPSAAREHKWRGHEPRSYLTAFIALMTIANDIRRILPTNRY
ncbi:hypothetical protein J2R80_000579 [Bradyrhizobium sp. USDA 4541]|nr:hypothetical protein [Bradyrhizobium sp. USDA 4541]